jgi:hypothetical protein
MTNRFIGKLLVPLLIVTALTAVGCSAAASGAQDEYTESKALQQAELYVEYSPTFIYDGIDQSLKLVETLYPDTENTWQFVFQFESRHSGYGDRDGQMLLQVITPHEVIITIQDGKVTTAIMDSVWDMVNQGMIDG